MRLCNLDRVGFGDREQQLAGLGEDAFTAGNEKKAFYAYSLLPLVLNELREFHELVCRVLGEKR